MENTKATIEILNDLVQINNDRIKGFEQALKELTADDADIRSLFVDCVADSHRFKMQLGTEVEALSKVKDIDNTTTVSGKLHRAWLEVKNAFSGAVSVKSVLEECEANEDAALKAYQSALDEEFLPSYIREMLSAQRSVLQDAHDEIRTLRDHV